jgi:hypothetical protein
MAKDYTPKDLFELLLYVASRNWSSNLGWEAIVADATELSYAANIALTSLC